MRNVARGSAIVGIATAGIVLLFVASGFNLLAFAPPFHWATSANDSSQSNSHTRPCNCIIFRADDIQDYWLQKPQSALLNLFIKQKVPLSVGMVMNNFGNDRTMLNMVRAGGNYLSLFEYDIHGWDHVNYTSVTAEKQEETLSKAQSKMDSILGRQAKVFFPPFNTFENNTLIAMRNNGFEIISSSKIDASPYAPSRDKFGIVHMPQSTSFGFTDSAGHHQWLTIGNMTRAVDNDIQSRGWAIVTIHPQDIAKYESETGKMLNEVDDDKVKEFESFIQDMRDDGKTFTTFEGALERLDK